ncbi:uncharacterized protein MELLADRAFT_72680 [Melampsora larici-populina 98AG31]|uniref:Uncharacterized protein n=1 Tax=Melampsora larici-populina (strain 98AG31 / pathotype 3-4-7) TaxID=747676 RepID=F4RXH1_MELLP|nr:uncharacterized protein MELLADRAFT_72680 [Melampsora larici-populina 98AG31]EGG02965.1 hypothetical protein MELLADRAFT_72680 [Melampsora larici-populina 98AG31]
MRLLDLPPHQSLWQSIGSKDEINLYHWIHEAFGQLLYLKKLWRPTDDWNEMDDRIEKDQLEENLSILKDSFQHQILGPLESRYGNDVVESNLNQLIKSHHGSDSLSNSNKNVNRTEGDSSFLKPAIVWRRKCPETGEEVIEWMSERTSDVVWPGLVSLRSDQYIPRIYWESEARRFANRNGGVPRGLGPDGQMAKVDEAIGEACEWADSQSDSVEGGVELQEVIKTAEGILIKQFLEERDNSVRS